MAKCSKAEVRRLRTALRWKIPAAQRQRIQMVLGEVGRDACAGEIGPIELCALHLCCEDIRASETRSAQIGFQKPSLIEYCPVELRIGQFGPVEPCGPQQRAGEIESGQIEARKFLAGEIGGLCGCCSGNYGFDLRARHL